MVLFVNDIKSLSVVNPINEPSIVILSTVNVVSVPTEVIWVCEAFTFNWFPTWVNPVPAVIPLELLNCVNDNKWVIISKNRN